METTYIATLSKQEEIGKYHWRASSFTVEVKAESKQDAIDIVSEEYPEHKIVSVEHWSATVKGEYL